MPATGSTATDVSLNFDKSSFTKEGLHPSDRNHYFYSYINIVTYVIVLCQLGMLHKNINTKKFIIHKNMT